MSSSVDLALDDPWVAPGEAVHRRLDALIDAPHPAADAARRMVEAGGKLLRPSFVLAASSACEGSVSDAAVSAAAAIELVHVASLIHDDLVDDALVRRSVPTVHAVDGAETAVLAGDYLFGLAMRTAAELGADVARVIAAAITAIADGQAFEAATRWKVDRTVDDYYRTVDAKTGALFAAACEAGALCARAEPQLVARLREFGRLFGRAFQVVDDMLDLVGSEATTGKRPGQDLREGTYTLPVLLFLRDEPAWAQRIEAASERSVIEAVRCLRSAPALATARSAAEVEAGRAAEVAASLPPSAGQRYLHDIAVSYVATALPRSLARS